MGDPIPSGPWDDSPGLWDSVVIGGVEWPGLAKVEIDRANKWDTKKANGSHGAERDFKGADLATVQIEIRFWTTAHYETIQKAEYLPTIEPDPGKKKQDAVTLGHPVASLRRVESITVDKITGPRIQNGVGVLTIDATECRKPDSTNATGTATGRPGNPKNAEGDCAQLAAKMAELQSQWAQANADWIQAMAAASQNDAADLGIGADQSDVDVRKERMDTLAEQMRDVQAQQDRLGCNSRGPSDSENDP